MANQLTVAKVLSIKTLYEQRWSQRRIARELGVSREAVANHVRELSKPANAPIGSKSLRLAQRYCLEAIEAAYEIRNGGIDRLPVAEMCEKNLAT